MRLTGVLMSMTLLFGFSMPAYAYLDPGTGSILIQGAIATVAGALVAGRLYWERIKSWFRGTLAARQKTESMIDDDSKLDPTDES